MYMNYCIKTKGKYDYEDIPYANEILRDMLKNNSFGFAVMNISKYSNDADDGASANFSLINQFLKDCDLDKRNFIKEEIKLLDPDLIVTANLWDGNIDEKELQKIFPNEDFTVISTVEGIAVLYHFKFETKKIKLLDLYHFSRRGSDKKLFYDPLRKLLYNK